MWVRHNNWKGVAENSRSYKSYQARNSVRRLTLKTSTQIKHNRDADHQKAKKESPSRVSGMKGTFLEGAWTDSSPDPSTLADSRGLMPEAADRGLAASFHDRPIYHEGFSI